MFNGSVVEAPRRYRRGGEGPKCTCQVQRHHMNKWSRCRRILECIASRVVSNKPCLKTGWTVRYTSVLVHLQSGHTNVSNVTPSSCPLPYGKRTVCLVMMGVLILARRFPSAGRRLKLLIAVHTKAVGGGDVGVILCVTCRTERRTAVSEHHSCLACSRWWPGGAFFTCSLSHIICSCGNHLHP